MTQSPPPQAKKTTFKGALYDILVLALMLSAAGFGGYFYGTHQKFSVIELVAPGTPGAMEVAPANLSAGAAKAAQTPAVDSSVKAAGTPASTQAAAAGDGNGQTAAAGDQSQTAQSSGDSNSMPSPKHRGKLKYWVSSSGTRFVGYLITVTVNDQQVDNFFAPGKEVDITDLVKKGKNNVVFQAKALEAKFNKHQGDSNSALTLRIDRGTTLQESVKPSDVLLTYRRNAAESNDFDDTLHFTAE